MEFNGLWCLIEPVKPEQQDQAKSQASVKEDKAEFGRPSVRCMVALREAVVPALARRMQNVRCPREALGLLKPNITTDDTDEWCTRVLEIQI